MSRCVARQTGDVLNGLVENGIITAAHADASRFSRPPKKLNAASESETMEFEGQWKATHLRRHPGVLRSPGCHPARSQHGPESRAAPARGPTGSRSGHAQDVYGGDLILSQVGFGG